MDFLGKYGFEAAGEMHRKNQFWGPNWLAKPPSRHLKINFLLQPYPILTLKVCQSSFLPTAIDPETYRNSERNVAKKRLN